MRNVQPIFGLRNPAVKCFGKYRSQKTPVCKACECRKACQRLHAHDTLIRASDKRYSNTARQLTPDESRIYGIH